jgi:hypothetical protein
MSQEVEPLGLLATRISLEVSPPVTAPNQIVNITGKLERKLIGWSGVAGESIELYVDGQKVDQTVTRQDGSFNFTYTFTDLGIHTVQAHFKGTLLKYAESWSPKVAVKVVTEEEAKQWQSSQMLMKLLMIGIPVVVAGGVFAFVISEYRAERRLELELALARARAGV